jgi:hypothetical protein
VRAYNEALGQNPYCEYHFLNYQSDCSCSAYCPWHSELCKSDDVFIFLVKHMLDDDLLNFHIITLLNGAGVFSGGAAMHGCAFIIFFRDGGYYSGCCACR